VELGVITGVLLGTGVLVDSVGSGVSVSITSVDVMLAFAVGETAVAVASGRRVSDVGSVLSSQEWTAIAAPLIISKMKTTPLTPANHPRRGFIVGAADVGGAVKVAPQCPQKVASVEISLPQFVQNTGLILHFINYSSNN
jgi:hypothetical protein